MNIGVIIPAAGTGDRFESSPPKQFVKVDGLPLLYYTIDNFIKLINDQWMISIVVVCSDAYINLVKEEILSYFSNYVGRGSLAVTVGSDTRHRSIHMGLNYLANSLKRPDLIIIHDGVRPLVDPRYLARLIESAREHGAAGPICDLISTPLQVDSENFVKGVINRDSLKLSEMPQIFKFEVIKKAYDGASDSDLDNGTECIDLVNKYTDVRTKALSGFPSNLFKVTYKKDLYAVEGLLKEMRTIKLIPMASIMDDDFLLIEKVEKELRKRFKQIIIETYRNGYNVCSPTDSLVFFWFLESWNVFKAEELSLQKGQKNSNSAHVILFNRELLDLEYADVVRHTRGSPNNYIIGHLKSEPSKIIKFLGTILWNHDHLNGYVHFL
ncbi:D-ribitol-5-phosphate cytidylyltransferase-like [Brevipalpus obovatus]|uniref:D-ribitol-5-phosphate cytidylyltransferase-like n=1 Tax=Brevipalpus obovatus TaxID=246614 RepID=UPI003D9F5C9F